MKDIDWFKLLKPVVLRERVKGNGNSLDQGCMLLIKGQYPKVDLQEVHECNNLLTTISLAVFLNLAQ